MPRRTTAQQAIQCFKAHRGLLRASQAFAYGITPKTLYQLRDEGIIEPLQRGTFRLAKLPPLTHPDLVTVALRLPKAVICLISALSFHGLTTQIPRHVDIAYQQGWWEPTLDYPPIRVFRYTKSAHETGIEMHTMDGVKIPIYSAAKTVADCFKFRGRIGLSVAIEALKEYWQQPKSNLKELLHHAKLCRVKRIMTPYLEAITHD